LFFIFEDIFSTLITIHNIFQLVHKQKVLFWLLNEFQTQ